MADRKGPKHRVAKIYGDSAYHWLPHDANYTLCNQNAIEQLYDPRFTPASAIPKVACPTCTKARQIEIEKAHFAMPRKVIRHFAGKGDTETACGLPLTLVEAVEDTRMQSTCSACKEKDDRAARRRQVDTPEKVLAIYNKAVERYEKRLQAAAARGRQKK